MGGMSWEAVGKTCLNREDQQVTQGQLLQRGAPSALLLAALADPLCFPGGFREEEEERGADPSDGADGHDPPGEPPEPLPAERGPRHPAQPPEREPRQLLRGVLRAVLRGVPQPQPAALRVQRQHSHLLPADPRREEGGRPAGRGALGRAGDRQGHLREVFLGWPYAVRAPGGLPAPAQCRCLRLHHPQPATATARAVPGAGCPGAGLPRGGGRGRAGPAAGVAGEQQSRVPPAPPAPAERAGTAAARHEPRAGARHHRGAAAPERPGD